MARNLCQLHKAAGPMEITLWGRAGCLACKYDEQNFDHEGLIVLEPLDVDAGESRCPRCRESVQVRALSGGACMVVGADGETHRHPSQDRPEPLDAETQTQVRALFAAPEPEMPPPWERWR